MSEDVGSSFRFADIAEDRALTLSSDAITLSLRDSRLEGGSCCDSVGVSRTTDSAATPGSVPLCSPVVDPPGIDHVTGPSSEGRSEVTSVQGCGSEIPVVPTSDQREAGSEGVVQSTQTAKDPVEYPINAATTKSRSFLEFAPTVHKEQNQEQKSSDRDVSKEELSPTGGGKSEGNTPARSSNGVSVLDTFCSQCGRKEESIEGRTSVSSRRCENCLCISTSITVFINHAQKNNGPDERQGGGFNGPLARQGPDQVGSGPRKLSGETDSDDIVPKVECPDSSEGGGKAQGMSRPPEKACVQQCRLGQPPADPRDPSRPQTKSNCHPGAAERSTVGHSNGFPPSRDRVTDESSPDAKTVVVVGGVSSWSAPVDRCATSASAALNGNKPVRRQKSLETIIKQLQPRQMSPVALGNAVVTGASPRVSMATPLSPPPPVWGWASVSSGAGLCGFSGQRAEESVGCRRVVRPAAGEGSTPRPPSAGQTDNRANSLLRRALTCSTTSLDLKSRRCFFPSPSKPPNSATAGLPVDRHHPQAPFNLLAPSIKRLKTMYEGLEASKSPRSFNSSNISAPNEENRRNMFLQRTPSVIASTIREAPGVNTAPAAVPEVGVRASCDVITKRFPSVGNGFDAPLELTTKESRDRKWRESSSKRSGDGDVLRTSFPLFDNR